MTWLLPLLATFLLLVGSTVLLATVGRRRHQHRRALEQSTARAIEGVVGTGLADLVAEAIALRRQLEDTTARGREMLAIEVQLGAHLRRPFWRQIDDAHFGHDLERVRRATLGWLARFDGLDAADRQILELLGLDVTPVRSLIEHDTFVWASDLLPRNYLGDRASELTTVVQRSAEAIACLRRLERELIDYRPSSYR